jgi:exopolysaccharide production protein ExoQ
MPPIIALSTWLILLLALLCFDRAKERRTTLALWVPLIWLCIGASRLPSQWIGFGAASAAQALEEGNPLDRVVLSLLILLAIGILVSRSFKWGSFVSRNLFLAAFLLFALLSVFWSDFPLIALKRWFRDLGIYLMILSILSDRDPLEAVRWVFRRVCYLLVPLSIVLIKYYPGAGRQFDAWSGQGYFVGVATSKNQLGVLCLFSGIFFFWDTLTRWADRRQPRIRRILFVNFAFVGMTLWLLHLASSATSDVCLLLGCFVIWCTRTKAFKHQGILFKVAIPLSFPLYLIVAFVLGLNGDIVKVLGRNPTLTYRTMIWKVLLSLRTNPWVGVGYDSFWLGSRLQTVWRYFGGINEAHNGYLDIYLDLGIIGLILLVLFLCASYRNIWRSFANSPATASLALAAWVMLLFYNVTEAAFKGGLIWSIALLGAVSIPRRIECPVEEIMTPKRAPGWQRSMPPVGSHSPASTRFRSSSGPPILKTRNLG